MKTLYRRMLPLLLAALLAVSLTLPAAAARRPLPRLLAEEPGDDLPVDAQAFVDMVASLVVDDDLAPARAAYEALSTASQLLVSGALEQLVAMEAEQAAAAAVNEAIAALPEAIEVTTDTYASISSAVSVAHGMLDEFVETYGSADAAILILQLAKMMAVQKAYDAAEALTEQIASVQIVNDLITALPDPEDITVENIAGLILPLARVGEAYAKLLFSYGEEIAASVDTQRLDAVRNAYETVIAQLAALVPGDVNGDGAVNAADALLALQHSVKLITLEGDKALGADVSGDGTVNAADALLILQYSVKLIDVFPVENSAEIPVETPAEGPVGKE